ncbi:VanW family protein ['Paenibacillus yunnanensis' Narsing Rao et al. 2020]|uniref:VanW family protein n=1 Tax=Paenibacillus tengchongensis TaxID=2608684 RepID=UPI00124C5302|nr:VanW family protein [Paenibacillus tengchongensis]
MTKIHAALIAFISLLLAASLVYGGLYLYGNSPVLPKGTVLGGWPVGELPAQEVAEGAQARLKALEAVPLVLRTQNGAELTLTLREAGIAYEAEDFLRHQGELTSGGLLDRVRVRHSFPRHWDIGVHLELAGLKNRLSPSWEQENFGAPVNATRQITADDRIVYTEETTSFAVDWPALEQALRAAVPTRLQDLAKLRGLEIRLDIPLTVKEPPVTLKLLKEQGVERRIAQFSTSLGTSGPGRTYNVEAAAKAVDGTVLPPGAVFDYGKAIEKAQAEYGFREAPVIVNGRLQPGTGGGICQVSSTLYNAALHAGLEIVERRNHSVPVNYLPKGRDATFAQGYINFRFRNNTGKVLVIKTVVQGRSLTIKLFGTFPRNVTYHVESRTVEVLPPTDRYVSDPSLPKGGTRVLQAGKTGYIVETYITKFVDGKAVEKKQLSRDVYHAQKRVIAINRGGMSRTVQPEPVKKPLVEDGIKDS